MAETSTLNLLYIQTVSDIERGWILTSADTKQQLALMQVNQMNPNPHHIAISTTTSLHFQFSLTLMIVINYLEIDSGI